MHLLVGDPVRTLDDHLARGGAEGLARAVEIGPEATIAEVLRSGLRGRGGAGFPTGRKWAGVRDAGGQARYVVVNGAEGEPGTFKDRALIRHDPFQVIEGLVIAAFAVGADAVFIGIKDHYGAEVDRLVDAAAAMQDAGICQDCAITVVRGPDEYLFGEEKALLEVIEGKPPLPRLLPPFEHGLFATGPQAGWEAASGGGAGPAESNPTLVNNVETLAHVPHILRRGAD